MHERESQETEYGRVLPSSVETRMQSIQQQISLAFTLCSTVQIELQYGHFDRAEDLLRELHSLVEGLTAHVKNPDHVSRKHSNEFRKNIVELRKQILRLESGIEQR